MFNNKFFFENFVDIKVSRTYTALQQITLLWTTYLSVL